MSSADFETERLEKATAVSGPRRYRLVIVTESGSSSVALPEGGSATVGRDADAQIRIDDRSASRQHARLDLGGGVVRITDLGSANGLTVRGVAVPAHGEAQLHVGDTIEVGATLLVLQVDNLSGETRPWTLVTHQRFVEAVNAARPPFAVLRVQVVASPGVAHEVLSRGLKADDVVASFGPGQYEILALGRSREAAQALSVELSRQLVAAGARVRAGVATAPEDGSTAEMLIAACSRPAGAPAPGFIVRDDAMAAIHRLIDRVAQGTINVLVLGETGAGKEVIAQQVHRRSRRAEGPFLKLNCAALAESLLESELFGHEKGSFTGAVAAKPGLLESAQGGTIFLDEVGELTAATQTKLLRVLEERVVMRVGAVKTQPIDVRFVFATNRDLEAEVARGAFRADLYYRVAGINVLLPPLRDRLAEIEPLARKFAADAAARDGLPEPELTKEAVAALNAWHWPGNIRELKNVVDRVVLLAGDGPITPELLDLGGKAQGGTRPATADVEDTGAGLKGEREAAERRAVLDALEKTGGNQTKAAALLGVSRRTLVNRLTHYGLTKPRSKQEG